jgi:hypothetical protein
MRIAYLTEWQPYAETGVLRKLIGQVRAWRELGATAEIFSVSTRRKEPPALSFEEYGAVYGAVSQRHLDKYPFLRLGYVNKILSVAPLARALRRFRPDIVYYRQNGPWYPGVSVLLRQVPSVMEINTNEHAENKLWGRSMDLVYRATQARIWRNVRGFVCVTGEIADDFRPQGKPVAVVGNSFWGEVRSPAPTGNSEPAFVFVGSCMDVLDNWHGVDKVFPLAAAMPASPFHIVGMTRGDFGDAAIPSNVRFHGELRGAELSVILASSDIGLGTLALHRKNMQEACPLKVREYLMNRLPIVAGYRETETELRTAPYVLNIGNDPDNVANNIERIKSFAAAWTNRRVADDLSFLSMEAIESRRLEFLAEMASGAPASEPAMAAIDSRSAIARRA